MKVERNDDDTLLLSDGNNWLRLDKDEDSGEVTVDRSNADGPLRLDWHDAEEVIAFLGGL